MTSVIRVSQIPFVLVPIDEDSVERITTCLQALPEVTQFKPIKEMTAAPYNLVMRLYCGMIYMEARINCNLQQFLVNDSQVRMVLLKTLTDPLLQIVDLQVIIQLFKAIFPESIIVVNYTMMSPYLSLMKTLKAVAHVVYNSSTKYLSGHHGLMAGLVT
ncbi:hypothetical protein PSHT_11261, partial [Puccinia striiformis]